MEQQTFPNQEGSTSRVYIVTLLIYYAEYIMRNAELDEAQDGIKIARRNINNLRNADDNTLMAGTKEPLDEGEKRRVKKLA